MARYKIMKKTRQQATIKILGTGEVTIPLLELGLLDETPVVPKVGITGAYWTISGAGMINVSRGADIVLSLSYGDNWILSQNTGTVEDEFPDQDLTFDIQNGTATIIITVNKSGWNVPDTQAWDLDRNTLP